ncbi:DEAD/DEAH box helicase [Aspergillus undulatus]|uniref:DEAD/DEAH box helicase n=1 Tax=Aspergillus undulatus TaxID=1810928 RepID=UPI003CCDA1F3
MDFDASNDRPFKKRRFFVDDEHQSTNESEIPSSLDASIPSSSRRDLNNGPNGHHTLAPSSEAQRYQKCGQEAPQTTTLSTSQGQQDTDGFDTAAFVSIVGEDLSPETLLKIRKSSGGNLERAINVYFDGSWKTSSSAGSNLTTFLSRERAPSQPAPAIRSMTPAATLVMEDTKPAEQPTPRLNSQPSRRYLGAFGVGAWATRSGMGLVKHGDHVNIERARSQPLSTRGRTGKPKVNQKGDVLTRFTNSAGQEIGRLPRETAQWVSTLLDQKICEFRGVCVFAPDRLRVNDTVYLQLWCYLRIEAFQPNALQQLMDDNRATSIFEQEESTEEKQLRLRQVALVHLFDEIGLLSTLQDDTMKKQRKEGLLRAAEMADQEAKKTAKSGNDDSDEEPPAELEEEQLDALYKKAQSFDFSIPEAQPPSSFALDLRKYQKQALHWMLSKEKDLKSGREKSIHPLWEQYVWPLKDVDDKELPIIEGIEHFYVNPYSGELSLEFPVQEQHCLGGILADEMGLGKTIEMLSLVHSHRSVPPSRSSDLTRLPTSGIVEGPYTTLVVAPTSLLAQWESEAMKASNEGSMKVLMYYGNEKSVNLRELCSAGNTAAPNVIITSYGVVLSEHRTQQALQAGASWTPGNLFSVDFFRIILDEAHLIKNRTSKTAKACYDLKATHRWVLTGTPIVNRLEDLFSLVRFLKVEPWNNFSFWKTFITTPFESKEIVRALSVVQTVLEPLVLRRTKTMKTPDGEPLVPLPKRTVTIEEVELIEQEREIYNHIFTRAKQTFNSNVEAGTLLKSYSTIFAQLLRLRQTCCHPVLTRNKAIVADEEDAAAAADQTNELKDDMDLQELIDRFTATTQNHSSEETQDPSTKFTAHALRQIQSESSGECPICSEEPMIDPAVTACWHSACKKCLEDYIQHQSDKGVQPRCFSCRADIGPKDIFEVIRHSSPGTTPTEAPPSSLPSDDLYSSSQQPPRISLRRTNPLSPSAHTSAKIHALLSHLSHVPPGTKSVVFSQFTSFLDLIGPQLTRAGISHIRLDGTMPQKARAEVLKQFTKTETFTQEELAQAESTSTPTPIPNSTPTPGPGTGVGPDISTPKKPISKRPTSTSPSPSSPTVLLISLRAGGVGLNLTAASNVFMMDPWWSFAIEAQAIDRVHRMGQLRDVNVVRFIVKDSIEGRMLRVQERKMGIAGSLGLMGGEGGEEERRKERIEELRLLFE